MKLLFETYPYPIERIRSVISSHFYKENVNNMTASIHYVGYFYNYNEISPDSVFILPKVFLKNGKKPFGLDLSPEDLININNNSLPKNIRQTIFELSTWLYRAILQFYLRNNDTSILEKSKIQDVISNIGTESTTYLDIILKLLRFQKENRSLFTMIAAISSSGNNKIHWGKTLSKITPIFKEKTPVYTQFKNKIKTINFDEEIIILYFSVLNYLSPTYHNKINKDLNYQLLSPLKVQSLIDGSKGTKLLKRIKHKYYTDDLVALWRLLFVFFEKAENIANRRYHEELLLVRNFNIVFEDMIDHLIGEDKSIPRKLKEQEDGKIVDHIYSDRSLIDGDCSDIYFIGDSKYYKDGNDIKGESLDRKSVV